MVALGTWETVWQLLPKFTCLIKVLDAGCGSMDWDYPNYEIHRCDIVPQNLSNFRVVDLNKPWPYKNEEFTGVLSVEVLEHLENPWHFFREASRVCTDFIVVSTPNPASPLSRNLFQQTGRFRWFSESDVSAMCPDNQTGHITPFFKWQLELICKVNELKLDWYGFNSSESQEIQVFRLLKRYGLNYDAETSWEVPPEKLKLIFFKRSTHRYLLDEDKKRAWWASDHILRQLPNVETESVLIPNPEENEAYMKSLGYKVYRRDPIMHACKNSHLKTRRV